MTSPTTGPTRPRPDSRSTFRRLEEELQELGFEPVPESTPPGYTRYATTDSSAIITITDEPGKFSRVQVTTRGNGNWGLDWSAATPTAVQLIALYAALNDDPEAALHAAAAAIGVHDPTALPAPPGTAG